jgi:hypothetical protein
VSLVQSSPFGEKRTVDAVRHDFVENDRINYCL